MMGLSSAPAAYVLAASSDLLGAGAFVCGVPAANLSMAASALPSLLASLLAASSHDGLQASTKKFVTLEYTMAKKPSLLLEEALLTAFQCEA